MMEVFLTIAYKGKNYHTNVIVDKGISWEEIHRVAEAQVEKQWSKRAFNLTA
ncbi:BA3454 family stress response protein [Mesobacillus subterraneus]|uniref:BA3454 family stress response protein n=1 Tax=Mesobacillus subterraneus TaxID=285983 RepID=A0A3R9KY15_9BACI|nr:BA3454 family stress response protein [Mesobacillus subterraneus]RSD28668.1 BA3454 family stress response protein [Mesobacillus subterraneus]